MKKLFLSTCILFVFTFAHAQNLHITLFGGISNYQGDLQPKRFTFRQSNAAAGAGLLYEITPKLYARANVTFGRLKGDDKISGLYLNRNLSFSSPITDVHLGLEYDLLNLYDRSFTPFVFAGISAFHFNPSTLDSTGAKVFLQPLGTEGQGFFAGRTKYNLTQLSLPFGGGFKFALSENIRVRVEMGLRKTFTDYLDDVSSTYADPVLLLQNNGQQALDLAFRGDELKGSGTPYPAVNSMRGNAGSKDWYYFAGVGVSFRLAPRFDNGGRGGAGKSKTGCPVSF
ncbi:MAG: hypothetical protein JWP81_1968 [Ferruginibacter sp.]|nr:hypothetical protein [Ferruginibacter sp.]